MRARLTVEENLFLKRLSRSWRETAFLQPVGVKHTGVLVGPHNGHLWGHKKLIDPNWPKHFCSYPPLILCCVVLSHQMKVLL